MLCVHEGERVMSEQDDDITCEDHMITVCYY